MIWGNRLGWSLAGTSAVTLLAILVAIEWLGGVTTAPTSFGLDPKNFVPLETPGEVRDLAASILTSEGDAAEHYREAVRLYKANDYYFDGLRQGYERDTAKAKPAFDAVVRGTTARQNTYFSSNPLLLINYGDLPELTALDTIAECMLVEGSRLSARKQHTQAEQLYRAVFSLGYKLTEERMVHRQLRIGLAMLGGAASAMQFSMQAQDRAAEAERWKRISDWSREISTKTITPMWRVIGSIDEKVIGRHNGDVFRFASTDQKERMWRVESVLKLGRMRYTVGQGGRGGDQRVLRSVLQRYAGDSDPWVALAAEAAQKLTVEEFRMIGR